MCYTSLNHLPRFLLDADCAQQTSVNYKTEQPSSEAAKRTQRCPLIPNTSPRTCQGTWHHQIFYKSTV